MKYFKKKDFLKLPVGTFFAKGIGWCQDGFCIKGESIADIDFYYHNLVSIDFHDSYQLADKQYQMLETGVSYPINDCLERDGMFEDQDIFLVFEKEDLIKIIQLIKENT